MDIYKLVERAKRGDDEAFSDIVNSVKEKLYITAYSYVGNREDALDIVSEGIYKAYISIEKLKDEKLFNTWITKIIINLSIDMYRKNKRKAKIYEMHKPKYEESLSSEDKVDLNNAIKSLKPKYKIILQLKYYNGCTLAEISEILDMPVGTVKTNLNKALKQLRIELREENLV